MASAVESLSPDRWLAGAVARRWPRARVVTVTALKGDASTRRFWRVTLAGTGAAPHSGTPATTIAIDLGPDDLPLYARTLKLVTEPLVEPPWVNLHRFLTSIGAAVPELYVADAARRMLLVEDVGGLPLLEAAARAKADDLYRLAADQLLLLHLDGTRQLDAGCMAAGLAYDERLFRWELDQFVEYGLAAAAPGASRDEIAGELDDLAARLGGYPRVFSHRDYHGHNLFIQYVRDAGTGGDDLARIRVIDFQDALMAPAAQDLAVLLTTRDTSRVITPTIERRVVEYYYAMLLRRRAAGLGANDFFESYRLCVLQHALKVIGRFVYLEREGKGGYAAYIPHAIAQARRALSQAKAFPALRRALSE